MGPAEKSNPVNVLNFLLQSNNQAIKTEANLHKIGFWPRVFFTLNQNIFQLNSSEKLDLTSKLVEVLTAEDVFIPKGYSEHLVELALNSIRSVEKQFFQSKVEKLLNLAEIAKNSNKIEICNSILNELDEIVKELESDQVSLNFDEKYRQFVEEVHRKYEAIKQGVNTSIKIGPDDEIYKRRHLTFIDHVDEEAENVDEEAGKDEVTITANSLEEGKKTELYLMHDAVLKNQPSLIPDINMLFSEDKDKRDDHGMTPLILACVKNNFDAAIELLKIEVNPDEKDNEGCNALMYLMKSQKNLNKEERLKRDKIFEKLIESKDQLFAFDGEGNSALHYAVIYGKKDYAIKMIELLDETVETKLLEDILCRSFLANSEEITEYILNNKKGVDINKICGMLFRVGCNNKDAFAIYFLIKSGANVYQLYCENNEYEGVGKQSFNDVICEFKDNLGRTPLMIACDKNDFDTVHALLELGVCPNKMTLVNLISSPARLTKEKRLIHDKLFKQLIRLEEQLYATDSEGKTPLILAITKRKEEYAIELTKFVRPENQNSFLTIIELGIQYRLPRLVEFVLRNRIKTDEVSVQLIKMAYDKSNSAIICHLIRKNVDIYEKLFEVFPNLKGNDITSVYRKILNNSNPLEFDRSPLMVACANHDVDLALKLVRLGANIERLDDNGHTALVHFLRNSVLPGDEKQDQLFKVLTLPKDVVKCDKDGNNSLDWAIISGKEKYALYLYDLIDFKPDTLKHTLYLSCRYNLASLVERIVSKASIDILSIQESLLTEALNHKNHEVLKLLIRTGADIRILHDKVAKSNDFEALEFLVENVNQRVNDIH